MSLQNHLRENIFPEVSDGQLFQVSQRVEFKVELTMPTSLQENAEEVVMRGDTVWSRGLLNPHMDTNGYPVPRLWICNLVRDWAISPRSGMAALIPATRCLLSTCGGLFCERTLRLWCQVRLQWTAKRVSMSLSFQRHVLVSFPEMIDNPNQPSKPNASTCQS